MPTDTISRSDAIQTGVPHVFGFSADTKIDSEQRSKFDKLLNSNATLLLTTPESYRKTTLSLLKTLAKDSNMPGIYVTVNRPCKEISSDFDSIGISEEKVFVMDMISETTGTEAKNSMNCVYLHSPQSLTDLAIAIEEAVTAMNTKDMFLIIDSFSTLFIYNPPSVVIQFANFITNKMRSWGIKGVLIALTKELDSKAEPMLKQFCDEIIQE